MTQSWARHPTGTGRTCAASFWFMKKKKKRQKLHTFFSPSSRLNPALLQLCKPEPIRAAPTVLVHGGGSGIFLPGVLPPSGTDIVPPSNISSLIKMMSLSKSSHSADDVANNIETKRGLINSSHMAKQRRLPRALPTKLKYEPIKMLAKGKPPAPFLLHWWDLSACRPKLLGDFGLGQGCQGRESRLHLACLTQVAFVPWGWHWEWRESGSR